MSLNANEKTGYSKTDVRCSGDLTPIKEIYIDQYSPLQSKSNPI